MIVSRWAGSTRSPESSPARSGAASIISTVGIWLSMVSCAMITARRGSRQRDQLTPARSPHLLEALNHFPGIPAADPGERGKTQLPAACYPPGVGSKGFLRRVPDNTEMVEREPQRPHLARFGCVGGLIGFLAGFLGCRLCCPVAACRPLCQKICQRAGTGPVWL